MADPRFNNSPIIEPKWEKVSKELQDEIIEDAKKNSISFASKKYYEQVGMSYSGLSARLGLIFKKEGYVSQHLNGGINTAPQRRMRAFVKKPAKLTEDERILLSRLADGTAGFDEVERIVAAKVFEKMLKYPDDFKFYDFYQTQLLKIKQQEVEDRNTWAMEMINRFFMGKLPPQFCPNCGFKIYETGNKKGETEHAIIEEGKVIENGSKLTSRKI